MVVGTAESLKALGSQLMAAGEFPVTSLTDFPPEVARPLTCGPYKDIPDFQLTFHLMGNAPLSAMVPHSRRNMPAAVFVVIAVCALVGVFTIFRCVVSYVL